jgi:hypothetical protein
MTMSVFGGRGSSKFGPTSVIWLPDNLRTRRAGRGSLSMISIGKDEMEACVS